MVAGRMSYSTEVEGRADQGWERFLECDDGKVFRLKSVVALDGTIGTYTVEALPSESVRAELLNTGM